MGVTDRSVDVVVVGAGIAGASAAWTLAAHHALRVELLELESLPGQHATGRSAAITNATSGLAPVGALAAAARSFLASPPDEVAESSLLSPRGLLWVADAPTVDRLDDLAQVAATIGEPVRRLDADGARALVPALRPSWLAGGLHEPGAMTIDVARLLDGYLRAFRRAGGRVELASPALTLTPLGTGWRVTTPTRTVDCSVVVDAAGAWADEVAARAGLDPVGLTPFVRTAFTFPHAAADGWPLVMDVASRFYFEPEGPGLLASPGDETASEPCDARSTEEAIAMAVDALAEATDIQVRGVRSAWAGLRTFAPDRLPVIGEDPDAAGFVWLAGQGGAGIKTAPAAADLVAAAITGASLPQAARDAGVDPATFSPDRFRH